MNDQRCQNILALTLLSGIAGGIAPPLLLILTLTVNAKGDLSFYGLLLTIAILGVVAGLVVAACVSISLFWLVNSFFDSQQTTVYRLSLFASSAFSFVISILLCGASIFSVFSGFVVHG